MSENRIDNLREELGETPEEETTPETPETDVEETPEEETPDVEETPEEETPEEEDDQPEEDEDAELPDKFKGKSKAEIVQSYQELEKLIGQRTLSGTERKDLKDKGMGRKDLENMEDMKKLIEGTDFTKMNAQQFAEWLVGITDKRAETRAREIYQTASNVQQAVRTEIEEATTKFPLLKSNKEFRELTLAVIEADASQGKVTPIIDAAKKVTALIGAQNQVAQKKKNETDRKRAVVERTPSGADPKKDTDEERVKKGLLGSKNQGSPLGGLGL